MIPWHCTRCHAGLETSEHALSCAGCGHKFPVVEGIPDFMEGVRHEFDESFSERHHQAVVTQTEFSARRRLAQYFSDDSFSTNLRFHDKVMRTPGSVLDVGCGAGDIQYTKRGITVGIDPAFANLRKARTIYPQVARSTARRLPFAEAAFDYVTTTDVLEHIAPSEKDAVLTEMARVLKPGGRMVHIFPVDSLHPFQRFAKRHPDLHQKHFVDDDGHVGYEMARDVLPRFERAGLRVATTKVIFGAVWSKWEITKRFGNEYSERSPAMRRLVRALDFVTRHRLLNHAVNPFWRAADRIATLPLSLDHVSRIGVVAVKPDA